MNNEFKQIYRGIPLIGIPELCEALSKDEEEVKSIFNILDNAFPDQITLINIIDAILGKSSNDVFYTINSYKGITWHDDISLARSLKVSVKQIKMTMRFIKQLFENPMMLLDGFNFDNTNDVGCMIIDIIQKNPESSNEIKFKNNYKGIGWDDDTSLSYETGIDLEVIACAKELLNMTDENIIDISLSYEYCETVNDALICKIKSAPKKIRFNYTKYPNIFNK